MIILNSYQAKTPGSLSYHALSRASSANGLAPVGQNQALLETVGKLAAREPVLFATSALGVLLIVCGLVLFGYWLRGTSSA